MSRNADNEDHQHEVIHHQRVRKIEHPEQLAARHRLDAVLAVGEGRLDIEEVHHLRDRQRDHGEIDTLAADRERADDHAEQRRCRGAGENRQFRGKAPLLGRVRADVARGAQKHCVAERKQAAKSEQQVEGAREQREAQRLHQEYGVKAHERRDRQQRHQHRRAPRARAAAPLPPPRRPGPARPCPPTFPCQTGRRA